MKFISVKFNKCNYDEVKRITANREYSLVTRSSLQDMIYIFAPKCTKCSDIVKHVPSKWADFEFFGYCLDNNTDQISMIHELLQSPSVSLENFDSIHQFLVNLKLHCTKCQEEKSKSTVGTSTCAKETQTDLQEDTVALESCSEMLTIQTENEVVPMETGVMEHTNEESASSNLENQTECELDPIVPMEIDENINQDLDKNYDSLAEGPAPKRAKNLPGFLKVEMLESDEGQAYIESVKEANTPTTDTNRIGLTTAQISIRELPPPTTPETQSNSTTSDNSINNSSPEMHTVTVKLEIIEENEVPVPPPETVLVAEPVAEEPMLIAVKQEVVETNTDEVVSIENLVEPVEDEAPILETTPAVEHVVETPMLIAVKQEPVEEEEPVLPIKVVFRHSLTARPYNIKQEFAEEDDMVDESAPPVPQRDTSLNRSHEFFDVDRALPDCPLVVKQEAVDPEENTHQHEQHVNPPVANLGVKIEETDNHDYLAELEELVDTLPDQNNNKASQPSTSAEQDSIVNEALTKIESVIQHKKNNTENIEPPVRKMDNRAAAVSWAINNSIFANFEEEAPLNVFSKKPLSTNNHQYQTDRQHAYRSSFSPKMKHQGSSKFSDYRRTDPFRSPTVYAPKPPVKRFAPIENKPVRTKCTICNTHIMAPNGSNRMQSLNFSIIDHVRKHMETKRFCCMICTYKGENPANVKIHIKNAHPGRPLSIFEDLTNDQSFTDETRAMVRRCFPEWELHL